MSCAVFQSSFASSNGVNSVTYYVYQNEDIPPKGIMQIVHGMCEYFLRYDPFCRYLAENGYLVCGHDHIGHGNSVRRPEDLGYFADHNGWQYLIEDTHRMVHLIRAQFPNLPLYILGHSMGSFVVRCFLDLYSADVDGAILSGTGGNPLAGAGILAASMVKSLHGGRYRSELIKKMTGLDGSKRYEDHYSDLDWLTHDHKVIDEYAADPKSNFTFTVSGYIDLFSLVRTADNSHWGASIRKDLPIYLFSGDQDPVGGYGKGVKRVYRHLNRLGIQDVSMRLYQDGRHEMLNELNRDEVYRYVLAWLDDHLESKRGGAA